MKKYGNHLDDWLETEVILAERLHDKYEEFAIEESWDTQKECKVKFKDLPIENQRVMLKLACWIINNT